MNRALPIVLVSLWAGVASAGLGDFFESVGEGVSDAAGSVGRAVGLSDVTDGLDGHYLDEVLEQQRDDAGSPTLSAADQLADLRQLRRSDVTLVRIDSLEAYVNGVMDKVRAAWPGRPVAARVHITSSPDFGGQTLPHGVVFIPLGTLLHSANEDELAAMLAHEYSHLLLKHHDKDILDQLQAKAFDYGELLLRMRGGDDSRTAVNFAKLRVARWAAGHALMPKWNRGQEAEADILGTDLLIRAGYNGDAMQAMLKKVGATAQRKADFVAANPVVPRKDGGPGVQLDLATLLDNVTGSLTDVFGDEHEDAQKRRQRVRGYVRDKYPDRARPPLRSDAFAGALNARGVAPRLAVYRDTYAAMDKVAAGGEQPDKQALHRAAGIILKGLKGPGRKDPFLWMNLYHVRHAQQREQAALENLQLALKTGEAPYAAYTTLASTALDQGRYAESLAYLDRMQQDLGSDEDLLDKRIAAVRALRRPHDALLVRCVATGRSDLVQRCNQAAGKAGQTATAQQPLDSWGAPAAGGGSPLDWFKKR